MTPARRPLDWEVLRLRLVAGAMAAGFLALGVALWRVQVASGHRYETDLAKQSIRRVRLPGIRGRIYDRSGRALAENRPGYAVVVYLEELRQPGSWERTVEHVDATLDELAARLGLPREVSAEDIRRHIRRRLPLPLFAWTDVSEETVARWAEQTPGLPGIDLYTEPVRAYPHGETACHLLGHVGRADIAQFEDQPYHYYLPEMAGRSGLERAYDEALRGRAGGRLVRVDVSGFRHGDMGVREPVAGDDLLLTLDLGVQALAERALGGQAGAVVVIDPRNGDVLALASRPGFDPNAFVPSLPAALWESLRDDPRKPLLNRAVAGAYPPGSTFKPVVAMAALANGRARASAEFSCSGVFLLGTHPFACWYAPGHGTIDLRQALRYSCNVYFYRLALQAGPDYVWHMAAALGLGRPSGIDLDYEVGGLVPDDAWKRRTAGDAWRDGDTCNLAIGQGALTATPVQMAVVAAALANGGRVVRPRLVSATRAQGESAFRRRAAQPAADLHWDPAQLAAVREGMRDVVQAPDGTGRRARVPGVTIAGKTGTAQYGPGETNLHRGWMIAFAPFDTPRYAAAMVIEEAESGGGTVAPRLQVLLRGLFPSAPPEGGAG